MNKKIDKRTYYFVPKKNKVTGELIELKCFTCSKSAQEYSTRNYKENVSNGKFIEQPVVIAFGENKYEALQNAKMSFPEHMVDSQDTLKAFKEAN